MRTRPGSRRPEMMRCYRAVAACLLIGVQGATAQSIEPQSLRRNDISQPVTSAGPFTTTSQVTPAATLTMPPISADTQAQHHTARNVAVGMLIGGAALGGLEANNARHCTDCFFNGTAIFAAIGVGAIGGAFIGWIASNIR